MPLWHSQAIILRRTGYGEADMILQLLTQHGGKVGVIAKGIKRAGSRLSGGLELFAVSEITAAKGRGRLDVLTGARLVKFYSTIISHYDRLQLGYDFIKELSRQSETVSAPEFFDLLRDGFEYLNRPEVPLDTVEIWFRLRLAALLGSPLNLSSDAAGDELTAGRGYDFDFQEMRFTLKSNGPWQQPHIKLLRLLSVKTPVQLMKVGGVEPYIGACLKLVRAL